MTPLEETKGSDTVAVAFTLTPPTSTTSKVVCVGRTTVAGVASSSFNTLAASSNKRMAQLYKGGPCKQVYEPFVAP